ncbi:MAG: hypothetical protein ACRESW_05610 [Nevskiales bacterium]
MRVTSFTAALALTAVLAGCGSGGDGFNSVTPGTGSFPTHEPAQASAELGCSWALVSDPDLGNIAFPDENATYWVAVLPALPNTRLRVEGRFPQARYFSFNVYDPLLRPVDAVTDYELLPRQPGTNPYRTAGTVPGANYIAYLRPAPRPEMPEANTLYSGSIALPGGQSLPFNPTITLIYRIYLPELDGSGGVPLPTLTLETADGSQVPVRFHMSPCQPLPPDGAPGILNQAIRESSLPSQAGFLPFPLAAAEPRAVRFYGLPETARVLLSNALGQEVPPNPLTAGDGGGFLSNVDNAYVTFMASRDKGSLYVVRAKAPSYARVPTDAPNGPAQLRYWSLCTNEFVTQRFAACTHDAQVPVDAQGYFTLVVSDPEQMPVNALPDNGVLWLPWGAAYYDSVFIYRHMLPSPHFAEAVQNIPYGTPPEVVMGEYYPRAAYCDRATIEAAGSNPAAIFTVCRGQ